METERVKEDSTAEDVALKVLVQKLACIPEDDSEEEKANDFSQEAENLRVLGAIIDEASFNIPVRPKCCLKPMRSKRIPAGTQGFVSCRVPDENQRWWMVSTAESSAVGREWISPRCVLTSTKGVVRVPVINLGTNALGWRRTRGLWKVTAVMEEEIETLREEDNPGVIGAVQESALSETIPSCSSWKDVNVNDQLSVEEKKDLFALLAKHLRCFSKTKGKTHLAEHY